MVWDFAEVNPFGDVDGRLRHESSSWVAEVLERLAPQRRAASLSRPTHDASRSSSAVVATDPPYYDNIGYADLSDFFYVWLRRSLASIYPDLFATMLTPKADELVATPYRHGGSKDEAEELLRGRFVERRSPHAATCSPPTYPMTLFYAFKQSEDTESDGHRVDRLGDDARGLAGCGLDGHCDLADAHRAGNA